MGKFSNVWLYVSKDEFIADDLHVTGNLYMEGIIKGSIYATGIVHVCRDAVVYGNISADYLLLDGAVKGDAFIKGDAELTPDAFLGGELEAGKRIPILNLKMSRFPTYNRPETGDSAGSRAGRQIGGMEEAASGDSAGRADKKGRKAKRERGPKRSAGLLIFMILLILACIGILGIQTGLIDRSLLPWAAEEARQTEPEEDVREGAEAGTKAGQEDGKRDGSSEVDGEAAEPGPDDIEQAGEESSGAALYAEVLTIPEPEDVAFSSMKIHVIDTTYNIECYIIDDFTYVKLKDIAFMLSGTRGRFGIYATTEPKSYRILVRPGEKYEVTGDECYIGDDMSETCVKSRWKISLYGIDRYLHVYNLGDNNYFRLDELSSILGFRVTYDIGKRITELTLE